MAQKVSQKKLSDLRKKLEGKLNGNYTKKQIGKFKSGINQIDRLIGNTPLGDIEMSPNQLSSLQNLSEFSPNAYSSEYSGRWRW
jgi:hypothetical protein